MRTTTSAEVIFGENFLSFDVFVFVDLDGWALQLVLLIRGVSNSSSRQRLCNQIEAS